MNLLILKSLSGQIKTLSEEKWIAESQSPQSDLPFSVYHPKTAFQFIAAYGALLHRAKEAYWKTDKEVNYFRNLCYRYNYNGRWRTFQEILERTTTAEEFDQVAIEILGKFTFYGNLRPLMELYNRTIKEEKPKNSRPRKPKRKRGYDDKGSLRPYHQRGRNLPGQEIEREDRRNMVAHPLLREEFSLWEGRPIDRILSDGKEGTTR